MQPSYCIFVSSWFKWTFSNEPSYCIFCQNVLI